MAPILPFRGNTICLLRKNNIFLHMNKIAGSTTIRNNEGVYQKLSIDGRRIVKLEQ